MFVNKCRICLFDQTDNVPLLEAKRNDKPFPTNLGQMYIDCLQLELSFNLGYPEYICKYCSLQLTEFHNFLAIAKQSFDKFAASQAPPLTKPKNSRTSASVEDVQYTLGCDAEIEGQAMQENGLSKTKMPQSYVDEENDVILVEDEADNINQEEFDENLFFPEILVLDDDSDNEDEFDSSELPLPELTSRSGNRYYFCKFCDKKFLTQHMYQAHVNEHKGLPKFTCEICSSSLNSRSGYRKHMLKHWKGYVPCRGCYKSLRSSAVLPKDIRIKTPPPSYQCKICRYQGKNPLVNLNQWPFSNFPKGKVST